MRALDLFCGGGLASIGLEQAGFDHIVGVDVKDHPNYPYDFIRADVRNMPVNVRDFDFVWASPLCQKFSVNTKEENREHHENLIPITRLILEGHPYTAIENVPQAPIRADVILVGPSVGLPFLLRRRHFELSYFMPYPPPANGLDKQKWDMGLAFSVTTSMGMKDHFYPRKALGLKGVPSLEESKFVMGVPNHFPLTYDEIGEGIPPAYAKFIAEGAIKLMRGE